MKKYVSGSGGWWTVDTKKKNVIVVRRILLTAHLDCCFLLYQKLLTQLLACEMTKAPPCIYAVCLSISLGM